MFHLSCRNSAGPLRSTLRAALILAAGLAFAPTAQAQYFSLGKPAYPLEFYDIDYSYLADPSKRLGPLDYLHYIPIGPNPETYLSLGGEIREQAWSQRNEAEHLKSPFTNTYDMQRLLADFYLHFDRHFAVFVQLDRSDAFGKTPPLSASDKTYGRVQQAFVEFKQGIGPVDTTTRVGRQEITLGSGRFVWVNDSSNIRTDHDGARIHFDYANVATLDLFYARPVTQVVPAFDDFDSHNGTFGAVYVGERVIPGNVLNVDEYYYFRHSIGAQYIGLTANEDRDTVGGRVWGALGSLKYDSDMAFQFGTYAGKDISAFGTSTRVLYTLESVTWQPGLQFQTSYFSGSSATAKTVGTFSAPFPRPTLLNYVGLETLENLIEAYPAFLISPASNLTFRFGPQWVWRASVFDSVYISRTTPLAGTISPKDRASFIGTNLIASAAWSVLPNVNVFAEYLHQLPGPAITLAGGRGTDAGIVQLVIDF